MKIFEPNIPEEDITSISDVLRSGEIGFGNNVSKLEDEFKHFSNKTYNVAVNSASGAAFIIFAYLKEKYGMCDIYTPSIGFTSPVWAATHHGHNIIWIDVNDDLLLDIDDYILKRESNASSNKSVIMPILYGGVSTIDRFDEVLHKYDDIVVVDSAHCATPTITSDFTFFSFHPYKPIAASDGGMISTNNKSATMWINSYRNFGRKIINDTYDIIMDGFKFYMNNLNATIALSQLNRYESNLNIRKLNYNKLKELNLDGRLLQHDLHSSYYFATLICTLESMNYLNSLYKTSKHYPMLHKTTYFNSSTALKCTEDIHPFILNLPLYITI
jgi:dTDP-4-amino-4,6-dideoxygalactose transaminase